MFVDKTKHLRGLPRTNTLANLSRAFIIFDIITLSFLTTVTLRANKLEYLFRYFLAKSNVFPTLATGSTNGDH